MSGSHFQLRQLPTSQSVPSIFPLCLFVSVISSTLFVAVYEMNKTHSLSPISHSSPNTHLCNLSFLFLSFHPFISLILTQLYGCLMLSPCCRERTEHPSSSGGMAVMVAGGSRAPMLCSAVEHSLLRAGMTPADWGSDLGPGPGSRLPQLPPFTSRSGPLPCGPAAGVRGAVARMWLINRRGCWAGNGEGRFASVSEIPARPLWLQDEACQSDLEGLKPVSHRGRQQQQCAGAPQLLQDTSLKYLCPSPMGWLVWFPVQSDLRILI